MTKEEIQNEEDVIQYFGGRDGVNIGVVMTNFDHTIDKELEEKLKSTPKTVAEYSAWDFHGQVFFKDGQFHCAVSQYKSFQKLVSAETLEEIMETCSGLYGSE